MAASSTYTPIATYTASSAASYTFSSIPGTYTDLIIIINAKNSNAGTAVNNWRFQFNGDTASNYSDIFITGNGSTVTSSRDNNQSELYFGLANQTSNYNSVSIANIMNYSNTTTYKTLISTGAAADANYANASIGMWRSTSAINSIKIYAGGSPTTFTGTVTLYGITAA